MTSAYYVPLVTLPKIINAPGKYKTRRGETVTIITVSSKHDHGCEGYYDVGRLVESWHYSGRLYASKLSDNDIVSKIEV